MDECERYLGGVGGARTGLYAVLIAPHVRVLVSEDVGSDQADVEHDCGFDKGSTVEGLIIFRNSRRPARTRVSPMPGKRRFSSFNTTRKNTTAQTAVDTQIL
jgi:hypothetical protein